MPFRLVQLTDAHIGSVWSGDASESLARAIAAVERVLGGDAPDAVIVTGDIAHTGTDAEYELARALLDGFGAPLYVIPGNHDDRDGMRRHFAFPETDGALLSYTAALGPVRLVALDTTVPGSDGGSVDAERLAWLDRVLGSDTATPTVLAMHHPPLVTGLPAMDAIGISAAERGGLEALLQRHPQVTLIIAGHVHRTIAGSIGRAAVLAIPSTDVQVALDLESEQLRLVPEPPCFALHLLEDGRLVSHVQPV